MMLKLYLLYCPSDNGIIIPFLLTRNITLISQPSVPTSASQENVALFPTEAVTLLKGKDVTVVVGHASEEKNKQTKSYNFKTFKTTFDS